MLLSIFTSQPVVTPYNSLTHECRQCKLFSITLRSGELTPDPDILHYLGYCDTIDYVNGDVLLKNLI